MTPALRRASLGLGAGLLAALVACTAPGRAWEESLADLRLRLRAAGDPPGTVVLVGVHDSDLASFGTWPFPRGIHADILRILAGMQPRHVMMDILFPEPSASPEQDARLREAVSELPSATLPYFFERVEWEETPASGAHFLPGHHYGFDRSRGRLPFGAGPVPPFAPLDCSFGAANGPPEPVPSVLRRVPLFFRHQDRLHPGLSMQAVIQGLGLAPDQVRVEAGRGVTLTPSDAPPLHIPLDTDGLHRIGFTRKTASLEALSYGDLYRTLKDGEFRKRVQSLVRDRLVLVGYMAAGSVDVVNTPLGPMPGLAVHANLAHALLAGLHPRVPGPAWSLLVAPALGLGCASLMRRSPRVNLALLLGVGLLPAGLLLLPAWGLFLPPLLPLVLPPLFLLALALRATPPSADQPAAAAPAARFDAATVDQPAARAAAFDDATVDAGPLSASRTHMPGRDPDE